MLPGVSLMVKLHSPVGGIGVLRAQVVVSLNSGDPNKANEFSVREMLPVFCSTIVPAAGTPTTCPGNTKVLGMKVATAPSTAIPVSETSEEVFVLPSAIRSVAALAPVLDGAKEIFSLHDFPAGSTASTPGHVLLTIENSEEFGPVISAAMIVRSDAPTFFTTTVCGWIEAPTP
jgi:hypothetical protein